MEKWGRPNRNRWKRKEVYFQMRAFREGFDHDKLNRFVQQHLYQLPFRSERNSTHYKLWFRRTQQLMETKSWRMISPEFDYFDIRCWKCSKSRTKQARGLPIIIGRYLCMSLTFWRIAATGRNAVNCVGVCIERTIPVWRTYLSAFLQQSR